MTPDKHRRLMESQTTTATKVYEVVPIKEGWPVHLIYDALLRKGCSLQQSVIRGCLKVLAEAGLVSEANGTFSRAPVRAPSTVAEHAAAATGHVPMSTVVPTAMDKLASVASELRRLGKEAEALAKRADDLALEIEQEQSATAGQLSAVRQLKALINSV